MQSKSSLFNNYKIFLYCLIYIFCIQRANAFSLIFCTFPACRLIAHPTEAVPFLAVDEFQVDERCRHQHS